MAMVDTLKSLNLESCIAYLLCNNENVETRDDGDTLHTQLVYKPSNCVPNGPGFMFPRQDHVDYISLVLWNLDIKQFESNILITN